MILSVIRQCNTNASLAGAVLREQDISVASRVELQREWAPALSALDILVATRGFLNLLVGLAFLVRSLLPVGFMVAMSPAHGGSIEIVICTGHGQQSLTLNEKGVPLPAKSPVSSTDVCPFAPAGTVAIHHGVSHQLVRTVRYASVSYRIASEHFRATPRPGAQSARGPPATLI